MAVLFVQFLNIHNNEYWPNGIKISQNIAKYQISSTEIAKLF